MWTDKRTGEGPDIMKLIVALRPFGNAPKYFPFASSRELRPFKWVAFRPVLLPVRKRMG